MPRLANSEYHLKDWLSCRTIFTFVEPKCKRGLTSQGSVAVLVQCISPWRIEYQLDLKPRLTNRPTQHKTALASWTHDLTSRDMVQVVKMWHVEPVCSSNC